MSEEQITFYAPALFVTFFVMAAMALVIAPIAWIYKSCSSNPPAYDPGREVFIFQFRNLAGMAFLSLILNIFRFIDGAPGGVLQFLPEGLLLAFMGWRFLVSSREHEGAPDRKILREAGRIARQFGLCLIGWTLTFAAGFTVYTIVITFGGDGGLAAMSAGFLTGGLWIVSVAWAFFFFKKRAPDPATAMEGYRFYDLLWPVMMAFVALLVPLMIQDFANSKDFQEMMHSKRPPRRI